MASKVSKVRIVKCPKCLRLLMEYSDVPVYTCGGCGAVLKAKNWQANNKSSVSQMLGSISSEENLSQHGSDAEGSLNVIPTLLNRQAALFSTDSNSTDIDHVGGHKHVAIPSEKNSCSDSESSYHKEENSSECTENPNVEAGLTNDNLSSTGQTEMLGEDTIFVASDQRGATIQVNMDFFSEQQLDNPWKVSEHESVDSSAGCRINATENSLASEDIVDADPGNISCEKMNVPTAGNAHACNGNDSSYDGLSNSPEQYLLLSSAVGDKEISNFNNTRENDGKVDSLSENTEDSKSDVQSSNLSSNSSGERCASIAIFGNSDSNPRSSLNHAYYRENSQQSEIFHSARKELEDESLSMPLSKDSSFRDLRRYNWKDLTHKDKKRTKGFPSSAAPGKPASGLYSPTVDHNR